MESTHAERKICHLAEQTQLIQGVVVRAQHVAVAKSKHLHDHANAPAVFPQPIERHQLRMLQLAARERRSIQMVRGKQL